MVRGLPKFREHFKGLDDQYVLIGGAAVDVAMEDADLDFRVTKDLDIVRDLREFSDTALADGATPADLGIRGLSIENVRSLLAGVYRETEPPRGR